MTSRMTRIALAVAVAAAAAGGTALMLKKTAPQQQGHSGAAVRLSDIPQGDPIASVSAPSTLSSGARIGKRAFDAKCASCHGENAAGRNGIAPPLIHRYYEPNHHGDAAFMRAAKFGVRSHHWQFGDMPPVEGLTDADVKSITRYVREVQKENGIF